VLENIETPLATNVPHVDRSLAPLASPRQASLRVLPGVSSCTFSATAGRRCKVRSCRLFISCLLIDRFVTASRVPPAGLVNSMSYLYRDSEKWKDLQTCVRLSICL
jgi:hypothetical protein